MTVELMRSGGRWQARWPEAGATLSAVDHDGEVAVHPDDDDVIVVTGRAALDGRLVVLDAVVDLDAAASSRLVNGYQSWDYAGVRQAAEPGLTWWGGALAQRGGGPGLAFLAATAERLATSIRTEPTSGGIRVVGLAGGAPTLTPTPPSWGFLPSEASALDLGRLGLTESEPFLLTAAPDPMDAMERVATLAGAASGARHWAGPPILGWESWYHYGFSVTPEIVLANARLMRERFPDRFACVQIDDGWQRSYGDWLPKGGWPEDMGQLVGDIEALGGFGGLWLAPFMVAPGESGIGADRPDLLIGHEGDQPLHDPLMARHGLDATHPDALAWLRQLGSRVAAWGFRMVKLDFLYIGAQEGLRHDPSVTGTEALQRGLRAFVDGLGDPDGQRVYVLGCGMPYLPAVGICHGNRIGGDLAAPRIWPVPELVPFDPDQGWLGVPPTARNIAARWWSHGRLFHNDPDVVMACGPEAGPPYTVNEARALHLLAAACGGPVFFADDLATLNSAKRAALEDPEILALSWNDGFRPEYLFEHVDTAPVPEFYAQPTALPSHWRGRRVVDFDWDRHAAR
ncbi:MAG: hypothetical protein HYU28_06275 [Actinobacteria bacterium]|nr:hypothetical protein [Actinomycetota bacterium]